MNPRLKSALKCTLCLGVFSLVNGFLPITCWEPSICPPRGGTSTELPATSSRDLKKDERSSTSKVASRLARASKEAATIRAEKERLAALEEDQREGPELTSVVRLVQLIDEELSEPFGGIRPSRETSSMRVLLGHNDKTKEKKSLTKEERRDIALVFSKPLRDDQITTEYASRIVSLARAIKFDGYEPDLICFFGPTTPEKGKLVSETAAGVVFFRHLCAANKISLRNVDIRVIRHDSDFASWSSRSFRAVAKELFRGDYLESWLEASEVYESPTDEYGQTRKDPRKKIHLHWTLISNDYHLCNINDVHVRSPRQSPLNYLRHELEQRVRSNNGIVGSTWCFRYSLYPYLHSKDPVAAFLGKCYLLAQDLYPVLVNIRAVTKQSEFFQRDNFRALVAARRSLVTLLEGMDTAFRDNKIMETSMASIDPSLKEQLRNVGIMQGVKFNATVDVALENALLSMGRCADLVRPAGTLSSKSTTRDDWQNAQQHLEDCLDVIEQACDPDIPLPPERWGKLSLDNETISFEDSIFLEDHHTFETDTQGEDSL